MRPIVPEVHQQKHNKHTLSEHDGYWGRRAPPVRPAFMHGGGEGIGGWVARLAEHAVSPFRAALSPMKFNRSSPQKSKRQSSPRKKQSPMRPLPPLPKMPSPLKEIPSTAAQVNLTFNVVNNVTNNNVSTPGWNSQAFGAHMFRYGQKANGLEVQMKPLNTNRFVTLAGEALSHPQHHLQSTGQTGEPLAREVLDAVEKALKRNSEANSIVKSPARRSPRRN